MDPDRPDRPDRILDQWDSVASQVKPPPVPPRRVVVRSGLGGPGLVGGGLILAAILVAFVWIGRPGQTGPGADSASASPAASELAVASPSETPAPTTSAVPSETPAPSATPVPSASAAASATPTPPPVEAVGPCVEATLPARITSWEGAAGSRIATVELTNAGSVACTVRAMSKPQFVDGKGSVLIDGATPQASKALTVEPGGRLKTLVSVANYCGPDPIPPISLAFVMGSGSGRIVATPTSPKDLTLPPCNGAPGSAGDIGMHPWAP